MHLKFNLWKIQIFDEHLLVKYPGFYDIKVVNKYHKLLFYQEDFETLTHPKFWNLEKNHLTKKQMSRSHSKASSICQGYLGYSKSRRNSDDSQKSKATNKSKGYISKKLAK